MYRDMDGVCSSVGCWCRRLAVSVLGSCYSFAARKVRGWLEPPTRPSLSPQGTSTRYIKFYSPQASVYPYKWHPSGGLLVGLPSLLCPYWDTPVVLCMPSVLNAARSSPATEARSNNRTRASTAAYR